VGLSSLAPDTDWVISGINEGANLGADVYPSGTVAAAREAVLLGKPAVAVSHYLKRMRPPDWQQAATWTREVLRTLLDRPPAPGSFWNVNLPHLDSPTAMPEVIFCELDRNPLPVKFRLDGESYHYEASYQDRQRDEGRDVERCLAGNIVVTYLSLL
jgi:5'-nucleotidase